MQPEPGRRLERGVPERGCLARAASSTSSAVASSPASVRASPASIRSCGRSRRPGGRTAAARRSRLAVAGMSPAGEGPAAGRGQSLGGADPELDAVLVERSELGQVAMGLLQVVAEDLLELERPVAIRVDRVGPLDEPLVQRRRGSA